MFNTLRGWFEATLPDAAAASGLDEDRVALAALLVHAVAIDGQVRASEKAALEQVLSARFGLQAAQTEALIAEAEAREREAVDLYGYTSVLKRALDDEGRADAIEMLWRTVLADGTLSEFEDNLVWRVAELLGVSTRERVRLRKRAEADAPAADDLARLDR